jgi:hypothetical protein
MSIDACPSFMASRLRNEFQRYTNPMPGDDMLSAPPVAADQRLRSGPQPYCRSNQPFRAFFLLLV